MQGENDDDQYDGHDDNSADDFLFCIVASIRDRIAIA